MVAEREPRQTADNRPTFRVGKFELPEQEEYTSRDIINYTGMSPAQLSSALKKAKREGQPIEVRVEGRTYYYKNESVEKLLTFAQRANSRRGRKSPTMFMEKPVDKNPEGTKNKILQSYQRRKEIEERIALMSFDENDFGVRVCLTIFSNLANEDAAKEFTRDLTGLLNALRPTDIRLNSLIGSMSKEEYAIYLVTSTVTRSSAKNPSQRSEREQWVLNLYKKLGQKDQFKQDVLAEAFNHFDVEYKTPTSSRGH